MNIEQVTRLIEAELEALGEQMKQPQDLFHFHSAKGASCHYKAVLTLLEPIKNLTGPEVRLQRAYLQGIIAACERAAQLLRQVEDG